MKHTIYFSAAQNMSQLGDNSVDLVVTSPPYPMIEMWDDIMGNQNPEITFALHSNKPRKAFELMHQELDKVWSECWRVLKEGSFLCINIGDATRTINGNFALYNNNTRVIQACEELGFINLPNILWKKTTNAPNKFMGSGMLPCGAYVTLEHEWILIFRKGNKRVYKKVSEKDARRDSSFFWEERNIWFSDIWEIKGVKQTIDKAPSRERNASYPLELPYRLINMYSQKGDVVLDPFMGLGTTALTAILCERNSVGFEIDKLLKPLLKDILNSIDITKANSLIHDRYTKHLLFVEDRVKQGKDVKYSNDHLRCKVMTKQETDLTFHYLKDVTLSNEQDGLIFESNYYIDRLLSNFPMSKKGSLFEFDH
ncbi:MAG: DNA-methyltransferase [Parabacteroides merdae]